MFCLVFVRQEHDWILVVSQHVSHTRSLVNLVAGFGFLFIAMVPVPRQVKVAFHIFGLVNFVTGLIQIIYTSQAEQCVSILPFWVFWQCKYIQNLILFSTRGHFRTGVICASLM